MTLEQKLRENLEAAANALAVPEPRGAPLRTEPRSWARGLGVALTGAAAVLVLGIPALLLWQDGSEPGVSPATSVTSPTTTVTSTPTSTAAPATTQPTESATEVFLSAYMAGDHEFVLFAERVDGEDPPLATVTLRVYPVGASEPTAEAFVGTAEGFFWNVVTAPDGVCHLSAEPVGEVIDVTVELRYSASIGCAETFMFQLADGELTPREQTPEDVARRFMAAWREGEVETMSRLADPEAVSAAEEIGAPADPMFETCEGAAGSVYCTWQDGDSRLTIRVATQLRASVLEVRSDPSG